MLFISADHCLRVHIPEAHLRCLPRGEAILAIIPLPLVSNGEPGSWVNLDGLSWMSSYAVARHNIELWGAITDD